MEKANSPDNSVSGAKKRFTLPTDTTERETVFFGRIGGLAAAARLTPEERTALARKAANARHSRNRALKLAQQQQQREAEQEKRLDAIYGAGYYKALVAKQSVETTR